MGVSVRDLVDAGLDEGIVKQAVDAAGFERKRGRGGLSLDAKGVAKVVKAYTAILAKLTTKAAKVNTDKFDYGDEDDAPAPKAKAEKKVAPKPKAKTKPACDEDDEDDTEDDDAEDQNDVEEADDEDDEE